MRKSISSYRHTTIITPLSLLVLHLAKLSPVKGIHLPPYSPYYYLL